MQGWPHPLCGCVAVAQFTSNANATLNWCSCLSPPRPASETAGQRRFQHDAATGTVNWIRCDIGSFPHHSAASAVSRLKVRLAATGPTWSPAPLLANTTQRRRRGAAVSNENLTQIGCCNELNAAYAAEGYARAN